MKNDKVKMERVISENKIQLEWGILNDVIKRLTVFINSDIVIVDV